MPRRILVMSNCQTGGLHATLAGMLPDDDVEAMLWLGVEPPDLRERLAGADVWVCSIPRDQAEAIAAEVGSAARIFVVPTVWFPAFHPDQTPILLRAGGELHGAVGPYHSKIVVWGWRHGLSAPEVEALFRPESFAGLGYTEVWPRAVADLRAMFDASDLDFGQWFLPLQRRGAFMLTNNHPRVDALVQLARPIAAELGAATELLRYPWEQVVPDGLLATSVVWPIYPGVGDALDLPGAFVWRLEDGELIGLGAFVERSLAAYAAVDPDSVDTAHIDVDPRFDATLAPALAAAGGR